jgi:hypothetical protein
MNYISVMVGEPLTEQSSEETEQETIKKIDLGRQHSLEALGCEQRDVAG